MIHHEPDEGAACDCASCVNLAHTNNKMKISMTKSIRRVVCTIAPDTRHDPQFDRGRPEFCGDLETQPDEKPAGWSCIHLRKKPSGVMHYSGGGFDTDFDLVGKSTPCRTELLL